MIDFCFFCVSYHKDYKAFSLMLESFKKHNIDKIPFVIAIQDEDIYENGGGEESNFIL